MKYSSRCIAGAVSVAILAQQTAVAQFGKPKGPPKATLQLVSSVDSIVPGTPFDLGIRFSLVEGWHVYWKNSGDSGLPPRIKWMHPEGFSAGTVRFPVPTRHVDRFDADTILVTNILEHDPMLLVRITPSADISGSSFKLAASVAYLVCQKNCIRESADLSLELPVVAVGSSAHPANEQLFEAARRRLPKDDSPYLTVSTSAPVGKLTPGRKFQLPLNLTVAQDTWIYAHLPPDSKAPAFSVFVEPADGLFFEDPHYPDAQAGGKYSGTFTIQIPVEVGDQPPSAPLQVAGVVSFQACAPTGGCHEPEAVTFTASVGEGAQSNVDKGAAVTGSKQGAKGTPAPSEHKDDQSFWERAGLPGLLLACFLYGLFINATPCVLPVLSIKVLGFVQQAHESRSRTLLLGLSFGLGVVLFFVILGLLASTGRNVLQFPAVVILLGAVVLALALSMLGVYTLQTPTAATNLEAQIQKEGVLASFGKGALAPVLGFACTGPLLAGAFGWATQQPPRIAVLAFFITGLGMASPYMLLGANPQWLSFLPKPGNWMITFERIMGFLLLAMVIWLLHPLIVQIGPEGLEWTLGVLVFVGMGCWLLGKINYTMPEATRWKYRAAAGLIILAPAAMVYGWIYPISTRPAESMHAADGIPWRQWSAEDVASTVRAGKIVFVDFTSAYCTNCKLNKARAIDTPEARAKMDELGIVPFQADYSLGGREIFSALQQFDRPGPPLNLIYPAGRVADPIVLDVIFGKDYLLAKFDEAAGLTLARSGT